ncbi:MAG: hypothetical protein LC742_10260 [Acidobacteria bacterium]|nr:hypothetical protein [Acidobacteriota bacterium]
MNRSVLTTWTWALLIAAALLVAAGALNFVQRLTYVPPLTDGVQWTKEGNQIVARAVAPDTAASRAGLFGILPGDKLIAISLDETHDEPVVSTSHVQIYLEEAGKAGGHLRYLIERPSSTPDAPNYYYVSLDNLTHVSSRTTPSSTSTNRPALTKTSIKPSHFSTMRPSSCLRLSSCTFARSIQCGGRCSRGGVAR